MLTRGSSFDDKIHQMILSCSLFKSLFIHALGFSYGDQIRKISTLQNRRKIVFCILKTEKWLIVVNRLSDSSINVDSHTKDDVSMEWHGIDDDVA